jgi:hypothetical protein
LDVSDASAPLKFVNRKTGADVRWSFTDQNTGQQLNAMDVAIKEGPGADDLVCWRLSLAERRRDKGGDAAVSPNGTRPERSPGSATPSFVRSRNPSAPGSTILPATAASRTHEAFEGGGTIMGPPDVEALMQGPA